MKKSFCKFLVAVSSVALFFTSCVSNKIEVQPQKPETSRDYKMIKIDEKLNYLLTDISYPEFQSYGELNKVIKNTVENNWKSFKNYTKTEWNELNEINSKNGSQALPAFEYKVISEVTGNKKYISVLINTYIFNGGAHGNTTLITYNYNTETNTIDNIVTASGMEINEISNICRKSLYTKLITNNKNIVTPNDEVDMKEMINSGAFPQLGNFEIFTLYKNKLNVFFEPYSVAPYAYGIQKVEIDIQ